MTLSDGHGKLSATTSAEGGGGSISGSGTTSLTITGYAEPGECGSGDAERHGSEQRVGHDHADGEGQLRQQCPRSRRLR